MNNTLSRSFISLSTGAADEWRCGTTKANEVWCWGNNAWSNLGNHDFTQKVREEGKYSNEQGETNQDETALLNNWTANPIPVQIKNPNKKSDNDPEYINLSGITKVTAGNIFGCAISLDKEVWCWGDNSKGQLGLGKDSITTPDKTRYDYAQRVKAGQQDSKSGYLSKVVDLTLGQNHACALTEDGDIYCWGDNTALELGAEFKEERMHLPWSLPSWNDDTLDDIVWIVPHPVKVPAPDGVKFTSLTKGGYWAHCALTDPSIDEYNLWCWGDDIYGLVSGQNDLYKDEIAENWAGKKHKNDGVYTTEYVNWHYWDMNGEWYPMFGQPLTNIKSKIDYNEFDYYVCNDQNQKDCFNVYYCDPNDSLTYSRYEINEETGDIADYGIVIAYTEGQSCKTEYKTVELKNLKTVDISEYDSVFLYTTTSDPYTLKRFYTDNASWRAYEMTMIDSNSNILNGEKISLIRTGVEGRGQFFITDKGHLYDFGFNNQYSIKGNGDIENNYSFHTDKVLIPNDLIVKDIGISKRSVCAQVVDPNANNSDEIQLYCWGSSTFGQLGFDNKDNNFSYNDTVFLWEGDNNEYFDKESRIESTPIRIDEDLTFSK